MGQQIEQLAAFVAETPLESVPAGVLAHAKVTLLDTLGVILAGTTRPEVRALRARMAAGGGTGATLYGDGWPSSDVRTAALLNGIAARSIELCEGLRMVTGQAAAQVLPGLLAIGEARGSSGRDLLAAFVLGYDAAARLSLAFTPHKLAHQNGQVCLIAAAAAGARLSGLGAAGVGSAMRIAATLVLTPSYTNVVAGATALNVAGGMSGFAAALAPELAASGFEAQADAIEIGLGNLTGRGFDPSGIADGLGETWHVTRNYFRLYATCNPIHPCLDALAHVLGALRPRPQDIAAIDFRTYAFASVMNNPDPPNYFASKYSLPHAAATMALTGAASHATLGDAALADPAIAALRHKVTLAEDPAMTAKVPELKPASVTVTLADGRSMTHAVDSHRGDFRQPFTEAELRGKFRALAGEALTAEGVAAAEAAIDALETLDSVGRLVAGMRAAALG